MEKFRVVFLDFDGVLNNHRWLFARDVSDDAEMLDPEAIKRVNNIITASGRHRTFVVLSTAWRLMYEMDTLIRLLRRRGFNGEVIGRTEDLGIVERGHEVAEWIDRNAQHIESFVVLDDLDEFHMMRSRHVHTDERHGLLDEHVKQAVKILNVPLSGRYAVHGVRKAS